MDPARRRALSVTAVVAALAVGTSGCTGGGDADHDDRATGVAPATVADVDCPADIAHVIVTEPTCVVVTVPEGGTSRSSTVSLMVTRVPPVAGPTHDDPLVVVGTDMADVPNYSGIAPVADRVGREVIIIDPRGVGHSQPSLDCPEMTAIGPAALAASTDDADVRQSWDAAAQVCFTRLTDAGIDLDAYNQTTMASDVVAVVNALGIGSWNAISYGTAGRVALQLLALRPPGLRSMFLDSPELPSDDPTAHVVGRTRARLQLVVAMCAEDDGCGQQFGLRMHAVDALVSHLDAKPIDRRARAFGGPVRIRYDGAMVVRLLRYMLTYGASSGPELGPRGIPALIDALRRGDVARLDKVVAGQLDGDDPYCFGYLPKCDPNNRTTMGAYLSFLCHDVAPERGAASASAPGSWRTAFDESPYLDVCQHWPVAPSAAPAAAVVSSDVPTIAAVGGLDPFTDVAAIRQGLTGLSHLQVIAVPTGNHNVLGHEDCVGDARNRWIDDLELDVHEACADQQRLDFLRTVG